MIRAAPLRTLQRRVEPAIYFPMAQDFLTGMTLILNARDASDAVLRDLRRRIEMVPGRGPAPVVVRTLDSHLRQTALAPLRIATTLVEASAVTAFVLGVLGLWGAMSDSAHRRRREIAVRVALGATGWRVIRQIVSEGAGLAAVGLVAGLAGSVPVADTLARIATFDKQAAVSVAGGPARTAGLCGSHQRAPRPPGARRRPAVNHAHRPVVDFLHNNL